MDEQLLALVAGDADTARFDARFAEAVEKRKLAMAALLDHVRLNGW
jgi:hypothetical protein